MTISQKSFLTEIIDGKVSIPEKNLDYFRERQKLRLFDVIVSRFLEKERRGELSRADLARRINKKPEQITRWLSTPSNWTLDTISDLTLAVSGCELHFSFSPLVETRRNCTPADLLASDIPYRTATSTTSNFKINHIDRPVPCQIAN